MRLALVLIALILSPAAMAADTASTAILGFSADGRRFAFEEYGRQDGSGYPYASIYLIDTEKNAFAAPPVHVRIENEAATIGQARRQAATRARAMLAPIAEPGETFASQPIAEMTEQPNHLRFRLGTYLPYNGEPVTVALEEIKIAEGPYYPIMGFRLTLQGKGEPEVLHEDRTLPERRNTALGYRLGEAIGYRPARGPGRPGVDILVIMVMVMRQGFEGTDVRYMAVTAPLPAS
ncbi:DUF2259 domain-containing protein [Phreatobacter aquaticus]|nr:DUF2259 domain-containing protein [Phreatobacter aquaticus]